MSRLNTQSLAFVLSTIGVALTPATAPAQSFDDGSFNDIGSASGGGGGGFPAPGGGGSAPAADNGGFGEGSFDDGGSGFPDASNPTNPGSGSGGGFDEGSFTDSGSGGGGGVPLPGEGAVNPPGGGDFNPPDGGGGGDGIVQLPGGGDFNPPDDGGGGGGGGQPPNNEVGPAAQLEGFETRDFGVPPQQNLRNGQFHAPTPTAIPGASVVTTQALAQAMQSGMQMLIIDVLGGTYGLPNSFTAPDLASPGSFNDRTQQRANQWLRQISGGNKSIPIVVYCSDPFCWLSYNGALRVRAAGFDNVYWYRGGLQAWQMAGLPLQPLGF